MNVVLRMTIVQPTFPGVCAGLYIGVMPRRANRNSALQENRTIEPERLERNCA